MTALELAAAGVRLVVAGGRVTVEGPRGRADLMAALREEVSRRVPVMRDPRRAHTSSGTCETCGDTMANGRGGWCTLCAAARHKALEPGRTAAVALGRVDA